MIKFLAAALVMTFVIPAHALTINNQCEGVSMAYSSALSKITRTCSILEQCQNLRTKCPQQIDEVATCDVFNSCMS